MSSFPTLVRALRTAVGAQRGALDALDALDPRPLLALLRAYPARAGDWRRYALHDPRAGYTRNGVDGVGALASLLVLVWTPGQGSAIHDHARAHCMVKVLQGTIEETLYKPPPPGAAGSGPLEVARVSTYGRDEVSYISDSVGLHRMRNPGAEPAVTLHLYTPPHAAMHGCYVYGLDGSRRHADMSHLYSRNGVRQRGAADTC